VASDHDGVSPASVCSGEALSIVAVHRSLGDIPVMADRPAGTRGAHRVAGVVALVMRAMTVFVMPAKAGIQPVAMAGLRLSPE
jgi:hypothetical protein